LAEKIETVIFQAQAHWCKVLGKPRPSYDGKKNEWTVDLLLDKEALKTLQAFGIDRFYIKKGKPNKDNTPNELTGKPVLKLTRADKKANGEPTKPIPVRDEQGRPWDQSKLIGNGSVVNVKIMKYEVKLPNQPTRWKPYLLEMQVWDLVEYEGKGDDGGFPTKEGKASNDKANSDDWDFSKDSSTNHQPDVDYDDEIPF
jgi:hypothetical protein